MALDFPTNPSVNQIYTYGGRSWQWNGTAWDVYNASSGLTQYVSLLNGLCGSINLSAGTSISVTPAGNTLTIAYTGGGGGAGVSSFNGLTGAVQGVSSWNGQTGTVSFTNYVSSFNGSTGAVTGVSSFNGLTGAVTGVTTGTANTFVALQSFTTGISASGGVTLAGTLQGTTANFTGLVSSTVGFSGPGTNITGVVTSFNNLTGAVQGVSAAIAGSGISVSGATGSVTITNTGVTGIRGGTGISVSSTTGYPTIGVTLTSSQSFIGSNVNINTSSWTTITSLSLSAGAWIVMGTATFVRGSGTSARTFALQITDGSLTYASGSHGMGSVTGNAIQVSCNSIITLGATTTINLQGTTSTTSSPVDYASFIDTVMGVSYATGLIATRIG